MIRGKRNRKGGGRGAVAHVFEKVDENSNRRTGGRRESMSEMSVGGAVEWPHTTRQCESAPFMTYAGVVRGKGARTPLRDGEGGRMVGARKGGTQAR